MKRYIEEDCRSQLAMIPQQLDDYIGSRNQFRVIDALFDALDLRQAPCGPRMLPRSELKGQTAIHVIQDDVITQDGECPIKCVNAPFAIVR